MINYLETENILNFIYVPYNLHNNVLCIHAETIEPTYWDVLATLLSPSILDSWIVFWYRPILFFTNNIFRVDVWRFVANIIVKDNQWLRRSWAVLLSSSCESNSILYIWRL